MKVLIEKKADLNFADSTGSPLQIALAYNNEMGEKFAIMQLEAGADPTLRLGSYLKAPVATIRESPQREELKKLLEQKYPAKDQDAPWIIEKRTTSGQPPFHVVSVYEGPNSQRDKASRIPVMVTDQSGPLQLLLISYLPVIWQLQLAPGVTIDSVLLSGPELSDVTGLPDVTRQSRLTGDPARKLRYMKLASKSSLLAMIESVEGVIRMKPSTIQAQYKGQTFTIDGETTVNFRNPVLNTPPASRVILVGDGSISAKGTVCKYGKAGAFSSAEASVPYNAGKWYFETRINPDDNANNPGVYTNVGLEESAEESRSFHIMPSGNYWLKKNANTLQKGDVVGMAIDLDGNFLYFRINGQWLQGEPGSGNGIALKPNRDYRPAMTVSADSSEHSDIVSVNFGEKPFSA